MEDATDWLSRNIDNYEYTLHNIPEEERFHLHGFESLKSRIL